jgi:ketosteroid isomerase-like protein
MWLLVNVGGRPTPDGPPRERALMLKRCQICQFNSGITASRIGLATREKGRIDPVATQPISIPGELPSEIVALIDKVLGGFNNKDHALYNSAFGGDAVVIDGIAPYRWTGQNAQARWLSDAEKWLHDFGVESETLVCDKIVHAAVVGTYAYVVISATLHLKLKGGQSGSRPGILTFTFAKQGDEWKVGSQAWGRLS